MPATANTVEEYISLAPAERQDALKRIRRLCTATLAGANESIEHGKPTYHLGNALVAGFASQAHHIAFYAYDAEVQQAHQDSLTEPNDGMVQFNKANTVDYELIEQLLHDTAKNHR